MASFCKKVTYLSTMSLTGYQLCAEQAEGQSDSSCQNAPAVLSWMCASQGGSMATTRCPWQPSRTKSQLLPQSLVVSPSLSTKVCNIFCLIDFFQSNTDFLFFKFTNQVMLQIGFLLSNKQSKERMKTIWTTVCVLFIVCTCSRFYRACLQRTLVCSLLTGALLEATAALGARTALPCPFPQGPNGHAVLKGGCIKKM